jgi:hypothetical protein
MGFFGKSARNVAVIDIRSSSVGAAYATVDAHNVPRIAHSVRVPLDPHATEPLSETLPRTLEAALTALVSEGAPRLRALSGRGSVDEVVATFSSPWQTSVVASRSVANDKEFVFTKQLLAKALAEGAADMEGKTRVSEMVIATLLNGYEVQNPFGKRVRRAELIILSSFVDTAVMELATKAIRKAFHRHHIRFNAYLPESFTALRDLYPHQRDFLVVDVSGEATDIMLVKHGLVVSMTSMPHGVNEIARAARSVGFSSPAVPTGETDGIIKSDNNASFGSRVAEVEMAWIGFMRECLSAIAKQEPLPRTVLLIAEENVREFLRRLIDAPDLRSLWLTEEPLGILPVLPSQFSGPLGIDDPSAIDPMLALLSIGGTTHDYA